MFLQIVVVFVSNSVEAMGWLVLRVALICASDARIIFYAIDL